MSKSKKPLPKEAEPYKFKKGRSGNPEGARAHNPVTKALKNLTIETYREVIQLVLTGNVAAIKAMVEHPSTPAIQVGIATAFMKAIKNGDYAVIERIAERIVGKIPDELKVTSNNTSLVGTIDPTKLKAALAKLDEEV
jgi:hypothetical protein